MLLMTAPNMETLTESVERSLQNCSLNHDYRRNNGGEDGAAEEGTISSTSLASSDSNNNNNNNLPIPNTVSDTSLELNSHVSLPYYWEQCLDLKTGEIYYINWRNGMKAREDPRTAAAEYSGDLFSMEDGEEEEDEEEDDDDDDDDEDSSYDSEVSSSESSPSSTRERMLQCYSSSSNNHQQRVEKDKVDNVLVVAGCKACLMYFMVPKQVEDCPKCNGELLHFDRSETSSS